MKASGGKDRKVVQDVNENGGDKTAAESFPPHSMIDKNGKQYKYVEKDRDNPMKYQNSPPFNVPPKQPLPGPLPIIRYFGRWIVLAGVVIATINMIMAAWTVTAGHEKAGQRVIATAAGLMLLLMGYSIWKVVIINAFNALSGVETEESTKVRPEDTSAVIYPGKDRGTLPLLPANTPVTPAGGGGVPRNPMPIVPLGASVNR